MLRSAFVCWFLSVGLVTAQTSPPMITHAHPVAVQRGQSADVTVTGQQNFAGVNRVLVEGTSVTATVVPAKDAKPDVATTSVKLAVKIDAQAAVGVREFRVASPLGISTVGQLLVVDDPVIVEVTTNNNTAATAQKVTVPSVICGRLESKEDVDVYSFIAKAGQTITCEANCARIQDKIHDLQTHADPLIALFDAEGRELMANDDRFYADPVFSYAVPKDGTYFLHIRDSKYDGDPRWVYALTLTDRPHWLQAVPLGVNPGQTVGVRRAGSTESPVPLTTPSAVGIHAVTVPLGQRSSNPFPLVVTALPLAQEHEPNDTLAEANVLTIPSAVNGSISPARDLDHFRFTGKKGQALRFEVFARRFGTALRSPLDSILEVFDNAGKLLANNDDFVGKDAGLVFTPPSDGAYVLRLRDLNNKGGTDAVYVLEADLARPDFTVRCDPVKAMIGPGSRTAWYVQVNRLNGFVGPVTVNVADLPAGVTVSPLTIAPALTQGVIVVSAAKDAPTGASFVRIQATAEVPNLDGKPVRTTKQAILIEEIYAPGGGRARFEVNTAAVCVAAISDVMDIKVTPEKVTLKPGEEIKLDVVITRKPGFEKNVTLDVALRHGAQVFAVPLPPGVTVVENKSKTLLGTGSVGHIVLKAAPTAAPVEAVPICVIANVSINFVIKVPYASAMLPVTVVPK